MELTALMVSRLKLNNVKNNNFWKTATLLNKTDL